MEEYSSVAYTRISRRLKALMIDSIVLAFAFPIILFLVLQLKIEDSKVESLLIIILTASIEPLLVTFTGSSVGHHLTGLRVRKVTKDQHINILQSYLRFIVKLTLGLISFFSVLTTRKHQAVHDFASNSIVVHKNPHLALPYEVIGERKKQTDMYTYPSRIRRMLIILIYLPLIFLIYGLALWVLISTDCLDYQNCKKIDSAIHLVLTIGLWIILFFIVGRCWQSRLYGCRRKPKTPEKIFNF